MEPIAVSVGKHRSSHQDLGRSRVLLVATLLLLTCSGCSRGGYAARVMTPAMNQKAVAASDHSTLSREHTVVIDVPETGLETEFRKVVDRCIADSDHHCTILQSNLSSGQWPAGLIKLRIDPAAVEDLVAFASGLGRLESRATTVEDLAEAIQDTQARIEMLTTYRKQLLELRAKATTNIEAAIKIASELSTVQSDIERATGEAAFQTKRVTTDVVTLRFDVTEQRAFWRPVREALRDFLGHLSEGMSQAITAVAYIVPWLFVVVPGLYFLRFLWRRRGR
jgi:Domain of unknown function (DUF4349)